jgi:hypothetical protein
MSSNEKIVCSNQNSLGGMVAQGRHAKARHAGSGSPASANAVGPVRGHGDGHGGRDWPS